MTANHDEVVQANFEIDPRDVFRVNLRLAKLRLLIGALTVLLVIGSLSYFFFLIGDRKVLLQLSPLIFGVPLIALAGPVLRLHAIARKYVSGLSPSQRRLQYTFQRNSDSYKLLRGESVSQTAWNDIARVDERSNTFFIYRNEFEMQYIPKSAFRSRDVPVFRDIIRSHLGDRAKLAAEKF
jgi:hypothetical protein